MVSVFPRVIELKEKMVDASCNLSQIWSLNQQRIEINDMITKENKMKLRVLLFCFMAFSLVACGGGDSGDGGDTLSPGGGGVTGTIDKATEEVAMAAQDTAAQIVASQSDMAALTAGSSGTTFSTGLGGVRGISTASGKNQKAPVLFSKDAVRAPISETQTISEAGECGGTMDGTTVTTRDDTAVFPMEIHAEFEFNDFCTEDREKGYWWIVNGAMVMTMTYATPSDSSSDYDYDITYTSNMPFHESGAYHYTKSCETIDGENICSVGVHDSGTTTYRTSGVSVSGNSSSGYDVDYTLTDDAGNTCSVAFTDLTLCSDGCVGSGAGTIQYKGKEIRIDFTSCDEFVVSGDGFSETYHR